MAERTLRIELSFGARGLRCLMAAAMVFAAVSELASENITLTTYYPAPSGIYAQMITTNDTHLARDGGAVDIGANHSATLTVNGNIGTNGFPPGSGIPGGWGGGVHTWDVYAEGTIGVGTGGNLTADMARDGTGFFSGLLSANGGVKLGDTGTCSPGTLKWSQGKFWVCDGSNWLVVNTTLPPPPTPGLADASATGQVGVWFDYQISGSNNPTSYAASPLPGGLSVNTTSGRISGKPTRDGTTSVAISATNAGGTGTATLTLTISPAAIPSGTLDGSCAWYYEHHVDGAPATGCYGWWSDMHLHWHPGSSCVAGWTPVPDDGTIKETETSRGCPPQTSTTCKVWSPMCRKN